VAEEEEAEGAAAEEVLAAGAPAAAWSPELETDAMVVC